MSWTRPLIAALDLLNRRGPAIGVRLARATGKSRHLVHPKHLVEVPGHDWYLERLEPADVVLDVGCAHGAHALAAARRVKQVVGIDYDVTHLRTALGPSAGPHLDVVVTGPGGNLDAAYLVARELRRRFERVSIYVPLLAKSAATLICLGGDELVLG